MTFRVISVALEANDSRLTSSMKRAASTVDEFGRRTNTAARTSTRATNEMTGSFSKLENVLSRGVTRSMVGFTAAAFGGYAAGRALNAGFRDTIGAAAAFETQMRNVNSITGLTDGQLQRLSSQVLNLSVKVPQSAETLAAGLYDIASSGFQGAEGLTVLNASARAATAGLSDTATAAQAITGVLNAYGQGADKAKSVSDTLFETVNLGVLSFNDLTQGIGQVVGTAAAAGVSADSLGQAIATMTVAGVPAAESFTSLNQLLAQLIQPGDNLSATLKGLGYNSGLAALQARGLRGVMVDLQRATGGSVEKTSALFTDIRSLRGALALMSADGRNYKKVVDGWGETHRGAGATMRAFREQMKATGAQWTLFRNDIERAAIIFGTRTLPAIRGLMQGVRELGHAAGPGLAAGFHALEPVLTNLAHIGASTVRIISALAQAFIPLGRAMLNVAAGGVGAALYGLTKPLVELLQLVERNKIAFYTFAGVAAVALLPALVGIAQAARTAAVSLGATVYLRALYGVQALTGGVQTLRAAFIGLATSEAAATAGLTIILGAVAIIGSKIIGAADKGRQAFEEFNRKLEIKPNNLHSYDRAIDKLQRFADAERQAQREGTWLTGEMQKHRAAAQEAEAKIAQYGYTASKMGSQVGVLASATGLSEAAIRRLANAAHINLAGALGQVAPRLLDYYNVSVASSSSTQKLAGAAAVLGDEAATAEDKVSALKDALDALIGVNLSAEEARSKFQAGLDSLSKSLKDNGIALDLTTEKGRANRDALRTVAGAITDVLTTQAELGASPGRLSNAFDRMVGQFRDTATAAGLSRDEIDHLLKRYGLVPSIVDTLIKEHGSRQVQETLDKLDGKKRDVAKPLDIPVTLTGAGRALDLFDQIYGAATRLDGKKVSVNVTPTFKDLLVNPTRKAAGGHIVGPGTGTSDSILARLSNGEFVMRAAAVNYYGAPTMAALNQMRMPRYAEGGLAGVTFNRGPSQAGFVPTRIVTIEKQVQYVTRHEMSLDGPVFRDHESWERFEESRRMRSVAP